MRSTANVMLLLVACLGAPAVLRAQAFTEMNMAASDSAAVRSLLTNPLGSRGPSGFAVLSGQTLRFEWTGDQPASTRAWAVRRGSCNRDEGALNSSAKLASLRVDASGTGRASLELDAPVPPQNVYLVVHNSSTDPEPVLLGCGSLSNGAGFKASESRIDHSAMDHSSMSMGTANVLSANASAGMSRMGTAGSSHDRGSSGLMAIHERMMADPVIGERVRTDPVLQRMINELHADSATMRLTDPIVAPKTPTAKSTPKKAAALKPVVKPTPKIAAPAMPGMDHSRMPGMKKPPS